ncbi:MAG: sigma-70 family RNA polymerase sigma factor [Candidatus Omnitrophica bacterium]|nr:sigma-70 family RNA polymerase sigma factor [Candidatus Omnitrophota bacterium]
MANNMEQKLVKRAKEGDKTAFEELVKLYFSRIYKTAIHIMADADEAKDMTQETFIKAYSALDRFDGRSTFFTWIYRILINLCLNRKKEIQKWAPLKEKDPRLKAFVEEKETASGETPEDKLNKKRTIISLVEAIDELSEALRTTLILVVFENMDYKQVGEILGCSEGTVAWRVFRAREILREKLKKIL